MKKSHALICIATIALAFGSLTLLALNMSAMIVQPPTVNGSDGQRKNILIGDNTIVIFGVVRYSASGIIQNSGYGNIYAVAGQLAATPDVLYGNVYWTLVRENAGWLVYVTGGS